MAADTTSHLTDAQRELYQIVTNDFTGRELRKVVAEQNAPDADKQAVEAVLYDTSTPDRR